MRTQSLRLELVSVNSTFFNYFHLQAHGPHVQQFCEQLNNDFSLDGLGPWLIFLKGTQTIVGDVGVKNRLDACTLELYVEVFRQYNGSNYAAEALIAYAQFAFKKNLRYLVAYVPTTNLAAQRSFERAKFIKQETIHNVITYRLINFNWYEKTEDNQ